MDHGSAFTSAFGLAKFVTFLALAGHALPSSHAQFTPARLTFAGITEA